MGVDLMGDRRSGMAEDFQLIWERSHRPSEDDLSPYLNGDQDHSADWGAFGYNIT